VLDALDAVVTNPSANASEPEAPRVYRLYEPVPRNARVFTVADLNFIAT
jgi:hypothetical protein